MNDKQNERVTRKRQEKWRKMNENRNGGNGRR